MTAQPLRQQVSRSITVQTQGSRSLLVVRFFCSCVPRNRPVFLYYCPDLAAPKNKMFYSSTKANVIKVLEKSGVQVTKSVRAFHRIQCPGQRLRLTTWVCAGQIEISEPKELSDAFVKTELYPQETVKKTFAKPGARGKGKRRLHRAFQS